MVLEGFINFGGSSSRSVIRMKIEQFIKAKISNTVKNYNKVVNKSITDITTNISDELINNMLSDMRTTSSVENILKDVTIMATKGSKVEITLDSNAAAEMAAVIKIMSSNKIKNEMANSIIEQFKSAMEKDANLKNQLIQAAQTDQAVKENEGIASMVDKFTDMATNMINSITGASSSTEVDTQIKLKLETEFNNIVENTDINENDIMTKLAATLKTSIKNMSEDKCLANASTRNRAEQLNLLADDGSEAKVLLKADATSIAKCAVSKSIGTDVLKTLSNVKELEGIFDSKSTTKSDNSSDQKASLSDTKETRDAIADTVSELGETAGDVLNTGIKETGKVVDTGIKEAGKTARFGMSMIFMPLLIIGGIIAAIVVGIIVFKLVGNMSGGDEDEDYYDEDMEGGFLNPSNILKLVNDIIDLPVAKRGLALITVVVVIDMLLKETKKQQVKKA